MKLDWAMLCTAADSHDGLAYILGGGWDTSTRAEFPAPFVGAVAIRLILGREEVGEHLLFVAVRNEAGTEIAEPVTVPFTVELPPNLPEGWDVNSLVCLTLNGLPIPVEGIYAFDIEVDGIRLKTLRFRITRTSE